MRRQRRRWRRMRRRREHSRLRWFSSTYRQSEEYTPRSLAFRLLAGYPIPGARLPLPIPPSSTGRLGGGPGAPALAHASIPLARSLPHWPTQRARVYTVGQVKSVGCLPRRAWVSHPGSRRVFYAKKCPRGAIMFNSVEMMTWYGATTGRCTDRQAAIVVMGDDNMMPGGDIGLGRTCLNTKPGNPRSWTIFPSLDIILYHNIRC